MIARNAFVFDNNIITKLTSNVDDQFLDLINLLTSLWQANSEPRLRYGANKAAARVGSGRGRTELAGCGISSASGVRNAWQLLSRGKLSAQLRELLRADCL